MVWPLQSTGFDHKVENCFPDFEFYILSRLQGRWSHFQIVYLGLQIPSRFFFIIIHYIKFKHLNCRLLKIFRWHTQSSGVTSRFRVSVTVKLVWSGLKNNV